MKIPTLDVSTNVLCMGPRIVYGTAAIDAEGQVHMPDQDPEYKMKEGVVIVSLMRLDNTEHLIGSVMKVASIVKDKDGYDLDVVRINRLNCTLELQARKLPIVDTYICNEVEDAVKAVCKFGKAVLKPLYTSKARGMEVVEDTKDLEKKIIEFKDAGNPIIYIQKFIDIPGKDLGVSFLGGKYLGTYARVASGKSWNTTTESGGKYESYDPPKDVIKLATKAQKDLDLAFTCVDVVETEEGPKIFEVSAFGGFRGLYKACNIDAAALYADFVLERI